MNQYISLKQLQDGEDEERLYSYDMDDYFFENLDKIIDKNYRKDDSEFNQIFRFLRSRYYYDFLDIINDIYEFGFELNKLSENVNSEYSYIAVYEGLYFIDKIRNRIKTSITITKIEDSKIVSILDEKKIDFIKNIINTEYLYRNTYDCFIPFGKYDMGYEEYKKFDAEKYKIFIFPNLIYDDDLFNGFCQKYFYKKASDYKKYLKSELYQKDIDLYNKKLEEI